MDLFSSAAAAVGGDAISGFFNHALAMRRQEQAQNFESDMFQKRYQMTVKDLQAAGLNPMLAYSQGAGSAPSSSAAGAAPGSAGSNAVEAVNSTRLASAQAALLESQRKNVEADTIVKGATATNVVASTRKLTKEADIKSPMSTIMDAVDRVIRPFIQTAAKDVSKLGAKAMKAREPRKRTRPIKKFSELFNERPFAPLF